MTQARKDLIDLDYTPYYHIITRCVRRAYLCGEDYYSGQSFEHRRQWIVDLIKHLSGVFCIDICAYAMMSNHYHLVVHVDRDKALSLSDREVVDRWLTIFNGPPIVTRYQQGELLREVERKDFQRLVETWRTELYNISRFMKELNQTIARRANQEDGCKGKFWGCRFKSQMLLDESALMMCMAYVDLNPVRAGMCESLEDSDFTSIQERLGVYRKSKNKSRSTPEGLMPFAYRTRDTKMETNHTLPFYSTDYLQFVDWIGRATRKGKRGKIPDSVKPIFNQLQMDTDFFLDTLTHLESRYPLRLGLHSTLVDYAQHAGLRWSHGFTSSRKNACLVVH